MAESGATGEDAGANASPADAPALPLATPVATPIPVAVPADPAPVSSGRGGKVRKFDRPKAPRDWRFFVGGLGKVLIAIGLLMFGFVAYQLWGTGIETARAQNALENEFDDLLAGTTPDDATTTDDRITVDSAARRRLPGGSPRSTAHRSRPRCPSRSRNCRRSSEGDPLARLEIPRIDVDWIVVAGVEKSDLKKGPGHYPETPLPGQLGNAAIAGHRTTYGQPFYSIEQLQPGDEIITTTASGRFVYIVTGHADRLARRLPGDHHHRPDGRHAHAHVVPSPMDDEPAHRRHQRARPDPVGSRRRSGHQLRPSARRRSASRPSSHRPTRWHPMSRPPPRSIPHRAPGEPVSSEPVASETATTDPATTDPAAAGSTGSDADSTIDAGIADAFAEGWFSDPTANAQVALWGILLALIGIGSYLISRTFKRDWVGALVGIVPFVIALYFFFQNVNRLLPPNL